MEHLMPCDSKRAMAYRDWTNNRILKWSLLYVYPENEEEDYRLFDNTDSPLSTKEIVSEEQILQERLLMSPFTLPRSERELWDYNMKLNVNISHGVLCDFREMEPFRVRKGIDKFRQIWFLRKVIVEQEYPERYLNSFIFRVVLNCLIGEIQGY
ncbi:hypothetical protein TSUD_120710 [Trifolium subterraneum]|uniref:Uncharacterized protein n=1 Tax=Trifolium subterraneum TaxID=3900 RepID=A0A2Z6LR44_TRISU|nr:hypothetical protein TSUD_120710 [Trifolium subterraneum]